MEPKRSFDKTDDIDKNVPPIGISSGSGLDNLILHEDFYHFLDLTIKINKLKNSTSLNKKIINFSQNDMNDMIQRIRSTFLISNDKASLGTLILSKSQFDETDQTMKNFIDSLNQDLAKLKIAGECRIDEQVITKNQNVSQNAKECSDAFGVKYSKRQTDSLLNWMIQNKYHPFPDAKQIALLVKETGLTNSQIVNWATNVRKRNLKGTIEGGKKPHQFLDFLFLAVHREKNPPLTISPIIKTTPPRKKTTKKTTTVKRNGKERSLNMNGNEMYHMITPFSYPGWLSSSPWSDRNYQWRSTISPYPNMGNSSSLPGSKYCYGPYTSMSNVPVSDATVSNTFEVTQVPTLFDSSSNEESLLNSVTGELENGRIATRRAVSPSFLLDEKYGKEVDVTQSDQYPESSVSRKKMKRSNSLTKALQSPEMFWTKKDSSSNENNKIITVSGGGFEPLWNDADILRQFTNGGLLNTPRDNDEDDQSLGAPIEDTISNRSDIFRASLTEKDIIYLLSTDEDDDDTFLDLSLDDKTFIPV